MKKKITFVIPCLNEERTLPLVLKKINSLISRDLKGYTVEILVSDNGSTDNSISIAKSFGARVVNCQIRGYGAALKFGIQSAEGEIIIFADADNTYDFMEAPLLILEIEKGYDIVIGSRLDGDIKKGAMPFLHRYLGTPVINFIINLLYNRTDKKLRDANSGFRCFYKEAFLGWGIESDGMEFASEMLIKSLMKGANFSHVPISLYPDIAGRIPHLKTWRDGMRHLLRILLHSPDFFYISGLWLSIISWFFILTGYFFGIIRIGGVSILGIHSMMVLVLVNLLAQNIWGIGLFLSAKQHTQINLYNRILNLQEDKLFYLSFGFLTTSAALFLIIVFRWAKNDFHNMALEKEVLLLVTIGSNGFNFMFQFITAHMLKRTP